MIRSDTVLVIDVTVLIWKLYAVHQPKNFCDFAKLILNYVSVQCLQCVLVNLSFDNYNELNDVKDYERRCRASSDQPQPKPFTVIGGAPIPSNQPESDCRIFSLLDHLNKLFVERVCYARVIIYSIDTDVLV